jgi:hypothetical protein
MSDIATWLGAVMTNGVFYVALGSIAACLGLLNRLAGDRWPFPAPSLASKLVTWKAAQAGGAAELDRQIGAYHRSLTATTAIATGVAIALAGALLSLLAASGHPASARSGAGGLYWTVGLIYLAQLVGTGVGYPLAVRLEQRSSALGPRYADMRRRRLADYRAPGLRWLAPVAIAVQAGAAGALVVMVGAWTTPLLPLLGAMAFLMAELQMWFTARVPRTIVTDDPATARRCDDLVRAGVIARLQQLQLASVGFAGFLQGLLIGDLIHARSGPVQLTLAACFLSGLYCMFFVIGLAGLEERLGGTVTGWWGRPMPE